MYCIYQTEHGRWGRIYGTVMGIAEVVWNKSPLGEIRLAVRPLLCSRAPCHGVSGANVTAVHCRHRLAGSSSTTNPSFPCTRTWAAPSWLSTIPTSDWKIIERDKSVTGPFILCSATSLLPSSPWRLNTFVREKRFLTLCGDSCSGVTLWLLWCTRLNFLFISRQPSQGYSGLWWCYLQGYIHSVVHNVL